MGVSILRNKIVIAEYISSGKNLIDDVISRGYEPVLLEGSYPDISEEMKVFRAERDSINARFAGKFTIIKENPDYNAVLQQVRELKPILVIAGHEFGIELATRLASDLGLAGNPVSRLPQMTQKDKMQEALKDYGIRYIRGKLVSSLEEAGQFFSELDTQNTVVKPARGAGTQGVYICSNREEMLSAVSKNLELSHNTLIQERITGPEYIVNTTSCNGRHSLLSMIVYDKIKLSNGTNAYNTLTTVKELDIGHWELVNYAYKAADAIGIKYGPVHGEYMIDERGPVLIEVNCRPMGASMRRKFLDSIYGHHDTDKILDSYLDHEKFDEDRRKPYRTHSFGALKMIIVPDDTREYSTPIMQLSRHLRSYYDANFVGAGNREDLPKTRNLETAGGVIYLLHEDEKVVREDCRILHEIEMKYPDLIFQNENLTFKAPDKFLSIEQVIHKTNSKGSILILSDINHEIKGSCVVTSDQELTSAFDSYEQGIIYLHKSESFADVESMAEKIYTFISKIRRGGRVIVPESTYCNVPYGIKGMEILLRIAGLKIEAPIYESKQENILIASKI